MLLKVNKVKGCTCGPGAEWSSLDFQIGGCVRRKLAQLLPITCTCHMAIVIVFIHSLNKYTECVHMCQLLSWVQGYSSKLNKVPALMEPGIFRLVSNITSSVKPSQVILLRSGPTSYNFYSMQGQELSNA